MHIKLTQETGTILVPGIQEVHDETVLLKIKYRVIEILGCHLFSV